MLSGLAPAMNTPATRLGWLRHRRVRSIACLLSGHRCASASRRLEAGRGGRAGERYWGTLSQVRGSGAATDFFLGGSLAPIGVTVSFLSATPGMNSIG